MKLSEHFDLSEFVNSSTAKAKGIDNTPSEQVIENLRKLCVNVLEPLREWYGKPITIGSGYRCPALNKAVGGVSNSQHMKGEAADLHLPSKEVGGQWINYIMSELEFDQLIKEHDKSGHTWIHVSFRDGHNRQHFIPNLLKK